MTYTGIQYTRQQGISWGGGKIPFVMQVQDLKTKYRLEDIEVQEPVYAQNCALEGIDPRETVKPTINKKLILSHLLKAR